ncbi:MAG: hypothetical protein AAF514_23540 [Verrucomicrobiota bacterium]
MKPLALLLCLFLLGCEKRAADPELEKVRAALISEEPQNLAYQMAGMDFEQVTIDQLVPQRDNWIIKRTALSKEPEMFAAYGEEKIGDRGWIFFFTFHDVENRLDRFGFLPARFSITKSEFDDFGDPVSIEKVSSNYESWTAEERARGRKAKETIESNE